MIKSILNLNIIQFLFMDNENVNIYNYFIIYYLLLFIIIVKTI